MVITFFLSSNLWLRASIFPMLWQIISIFKLGSGFTFYPFCFQRHYEMSPGLPLMWGFGFVLPVSCPLRPVDPFYHYHLKFMWVWLVPLAVNLVCSEQQPCQRTHRDNFFWHPIYLQFHKWRPIPYTFSITTSCLSEGFPSLLASALFQLSPLTKPPMCVLLGHYKGTPLHILPCW